MKRFYMFIVPMFFVLYVVSGQNKSDNDILFFEYDDSYFTIYKHTPDCYFIADSPIENGFCFQLEKKVKKLNPSKVMDMRHYVYKFNKKYHKNGLWSALDVDSFVKHLSTKEIYLKDGNCYIKVNPIVFVSDRL